MQQKPASATSETYKLKMNIFENGQPEELIFLLENFKKAIDGTITTTISIQSNCLRTIIYGETLPDERQINIIKVKCNKNRHQTRRKPTNYK